MADEDGWPASESYRDKVKLKLEQELPRINNVTANSVEENASNSSESMDQYRRIIGRSLIAANYISKNDPVLPALQPAAAAGGSASAAAVMTPPLGQQPPQMGGAGNAAGAMPAAPPDGGSMNDAMGGMQPTGNTQQIQQPLNPHGAPLQDAMHQQQPHYHQQQDAAAAARSNAARMCAPTQLTPQQQHYQQQQLHYQLQQQQQQPHYQQQQDAAAAAWNNPAAAAYPTQIRAAPTQPPQQRPMQYGGAASPHNPYAQNSYEQIQPQSPHGYGGMGMGQGAPVGMVGVGGQSAGGARLPAANTPEYRAMCNNKLRTLSQYCNNLRALARQFRSDGRSDDVDKLEHGISIIEGRCSVSFEELCVLETWISNNANLLAHSPANMHGAHGARGAGGMGGPPSGGGSMPEAPFASMFHDQGQGPPPGMGGYGMPHSYGIQPQPQQHQMMGGWGMAGSGAGTGPQPHHLFMPPQQQHAGGGPMHAHAPYRGAHAAEMSRPYPSALMYPMPSHQVMGGGPPDRHAPGGPMLVPGQPRDGLGGGGGGGPLLDSSPDLFGDYDVVSPASKPSHSR